jgi:16S rRNA processing protein RimM
LPERLLEVGRIAKAHGLKGEVVVSLLTNREERVAAGSVLHTERGPLTVLWSTRHLGRHIVAFEGVSTREAADALRNTVLSAEPIEDADGGDWVHELVGAVVVLVGAAFGDEPVGVVESVQENPASDLLVLESGALVPMTFVVETAPGRVVIDPPEGLFDL